MVSVIIPIYNSGGFLFRCLDSILAQTYSDWEAICVDDGSSDDSAAILDGYAEKDSRIKAFHTPNRGASLARNFALDKICGEYLMMIDSDDFIHPSTFEICVRFFEMYESDAVMFTYDRRYRTKAMLGHLLHLPRPKVKFPSIDLSEIRTLETDDIFQWATEYSHPADIDRKWAVKHCQPWRGMFRAAVMKDIRFIAGIIYEDFPWWSEVMLRLGHVTILNLPLYYYYPNFRGYIISSSQDYRISSLRKAIESAQALYEAKASEHQKKLWEKNFLVPFREKLSAKQSKSR